MQPVRVDGDTLMDERFTKFNPRSAADFLIAVANAADVLSSNRKPPAEPDAIVRAIRESRTTLVDFGRELRKGMPPPREQAVAPSREFTYVRGHADPYSVPTIVPHEAQKFLEAMRNTAGTATGPILPESLKPPRRSE
jgi:hypothetical protein